MPLQQTSGAASYDAFGGGTPVAAKYIEDFFQTWLRTGTGSSVTVPTGLNGAINETMVWTKSRSAATNHKLTDNVRGATKALSSNTTGAEVTDSQGLTAFSSTGYTIGTNTDYNNSGATYVDWQWVSTPKFFDVVTYTGNGSTAWRYINHNLGTTPKCIIIKRTDAASNWVVWHNDGSSDKFLFLNTTAASDTANANNGYAFAASAFNGDNQFILDTVGGSVTASNASGATYVAYLFAHNAGGFGLTGTDNVISCGSFTTDGSGNASVNLGYEPQWILYKSANGASDWRILDSMRGYSYATGGDRILQPNTSTAEAAATVGNPLATGFDFSGINISETYIYIAIRRGPMKVPTTGTSVFSPVFRLGTDAAGTVVSAGAVTPDFVLNIPPNGVNIAPSQYMDRLRGVTRYLRSYGIEPETNYTRAVTSLNNKNIVFGDGGDGSGANSSAYLYITYMLGRAQSFFDIVCYRGTGVTQTQSHNLGVQPELYIVKARNGSGSLWAVGSTLLTNTEFIPLNTDQAKLNEPSNNLWGNTYPSASTITLGINSATNNSAWDYVAYLFASCPNVSKVGSFTGTGATQVINCGFTGGARFVLIKATSTTGAWMLWDSQRGIVAGNDPYLMLNSSSNQVTGTDWVDAAASGFELSNSGGNLANSSGVSYIFLAIA